ncbi:MAG TPA: hypothetical protein PKH24_10995, partial [Sedimentisphaerales bacterium]|nr:hypothetical protein [Sedimentisphaerales bacterium]HNU29816.1 hypothetical protein [Sedimentisphaerales bacterium]
SARPRGGSVHTKPTAVPFKSETFSSDRQKPVDLLGDTYGRCFRLQSQSFTDQEPLELVSLLLSILVTRTKSVAILCPGGRFTSIPVERFCLLPL